MPKGRAETPEGGLQAGWAHGHDELMCLCPSPCLQLAVCAAQSVPGPLPAQLCAGLYLGSLCFKRSLTEMRQSRMGSLSKPSSPSLCALRTERKDGFFLPFSLQPHRGEQPCAATRHAAQQRTKLLSVVLLPAFHIPAVAQAAPAPALGQGWLGQGCSPRPEPDCPAGLAWLCSAILTLPGTGAMALAGHSGHLQSKQPQVNNM